MPAYFFEDEYVPRANELKRGMVVEINDEPHVVKNVEVRNPSSRGASTLYKIRFTHLKTKQKLDETLKGDDLLKEADSVKATIQYSYQDGDDYVFMNMDDYEQYILNKNDIEDQLGYLTEGLEGITGILLDGILITIELPGTVELEIVETAPGMKGASATSRTKPAFMTTGHEVQVPEYIETGETIKINTANNKFISRA
jgi:elongation factor P